VGCESGCAIRQSAEWGAASLSLSSLAASSLVQSRERRQIAINDSLPIGAPHDNLVQVNIIRK